MNYKAYIGSYSKLYKINFDGKEITVTSVCDKIENPSYLAKCDDYIYAVSEVNSQIGSSLAVLKKADLSLISSVKTMEGGACHVTVNNALSNAYVSNYDSGTTSVFSLNGGLPTGKFKVYKNKGKNLLNPRQLSAHAHFMCETSSSYRLMSLDLGADKAFIFNGSPAPDSKLTFISHCKFPKGSGPRHAVFLNETAYILTELSNEIYICEFHSGSGSLWAKSKISTLPQNCEISSTAAAIKLSPDKKYIFASNRGHNSIASFKIENDGLKLLGITSCGGDHPRDIEITPDGKFLFCANTFSDNITVFAVDGGNLNKICDFSGINKPSSIIFD